MESIFLDSLPISLPFRKKFRNDIFKMISNCFCGGSRDELTLYFLTILNIADRNLRFDLNSCGT